MPVSLLGSSPECMASARLQAAQHVAACQWRLQCGGHAAWSEPETFHVDIQTKSLTHSNVYMQICREHNVWLHVDGAWGGAALLSRKLRHLMAGCERADSVCWNPHKLLVRNCTYVEAGSVHMQMWVAMDVRC